MVGFSGNLETACHYDPSEGSVKKRAQEIKIGVGGTSHNVALGLNSLGRDVRVLITTGPGGIEDPACDLIKSSLRENGISHCLLPAREKTSQAIVMLPSIGQQTNLGMKAPYSSLPVSDVQEQIKRFRPRVRVVTGAEGVEIPLISAMFQDRDPESLNVLNPRGQLIGHQDFLQVLAQTSVLVVNGEEMRLLVKRVEGKAPIGDIAFSHLQAIHSLGPRLILVTFGRNGAWLSTAKGEAFRQGIVECGEVKDTTGAGDCMLAGFLTCYLDQQDDGSVDLAKCLRWGAALSGFQVCTIGSTPNITRSQIEEKLAEFLS